MDIQKTKQNHILKLTLSGRLDTTTSPALEAAIQEEIKDVTELELDFSDLQYISSAGLRVLLGAQKIMKMQGKMTISHANADIREVFDITGFSDILTLVD